MGDLKPIGSEKLQGQNKISRIMEIARYKEHIPQRINETDKDEYSAVLADGYEYHIVKEKLGYVIKKGLNESELDYVEPMKNRKHFSSYSSALKRLNLIVKEQNTLNLVDDGLSLFGEQKKYTLNVPNKKENAPAPEPAALPAPEPAAEMPTDDGMDIDAELDMDSAAPEEVPMGEPDAEDDGEEVTFKSIQKLTGKLGQKVRTLNDTVGMSSEDVKYVVNSIVSALDLSKLSEEDKEDIINRIEEYEETPDMGGDMEDELDMEFPGGDMGDEGEVEGEVEGELGEVSLTDLFPGKKYNYTNPRGHFDGKPKMVKFKEKIDYETGEPHFKFDDDETGFGALFTTDSIENEIEDFSDEVVSPRTGYKPGSSHPYGKKVSEIMDSIFSESKVDKVLESYFVVSENEKKFKEVKNAKKYINEKQARVDVYRKVKNLCETVEQELASKFILDENKGYKFKGKTNKNNLVFENGGVQIKITPKGEVI
jgi:hypothetical protein